MGTVQTLAVNVLHGDLGNSFVFREPAMKLIFERMPATLEIVILR